MSLKAEDLERTATPPPEKCATCDQPATARLWSNAAACSSCCSEFLASETYQRARLAANKQWDELYAREGTLAVHSRAHHHHFEAAYRAWAANKHRVAA